MTALMSHIVAERKKIRSAWKEGFMAGIILGVIVATPVVMAATVAIVGAK